MDGLGSDRPDGSMYKTIGLWEDDDNNVISDIDTNDDDKVWFEYVPNKDTISDAPSREVKDMDELVGPGERHMSNERSKPRHMSNEGPRRRRRRLSGEPKQRHYSYDGGGRAAVVLLYSGGAIV